MKVTRRTLDGIIALEKAWLTYKRAPTPDNKWAYQAAWTALQQALLDQFDRGAPEAASKQHPRCECSTSPTDQCLLPTAKYHHDTRGCRPYVFPYVFDQNHPPTESKR